MFALYALLWLAVEADIEVESRRGESWAIARSDAETKVIVVSKTGIGGVKLRRVGKSWPKKITVEVTVKGLEGLTLTQGDRKLRTALGRDSHEGFRRGAKDRWEDAELDKSWRPALTKGEDRVIIEIPAVWLDAKEAELEMEFIDFYR